MPDTNHPVLRFAAQIYPGGRHCLLCGAITVGAVFPPAVTGDNWTWRQWINAGPSTPEGRARTEQAAKAALLARFRDFLREAGLEARNE